MWGPLHGAMPKSNCGPIPNKIRSKWDVWSLWSRCPPDNIKQKTLKMQALETYLIPAAATGGTNITTTFISMVINRHHRQSMDNWTQMQSLYKNVSDYRQQNRI